MRKVMGRPGAFSGSCVAMSVKTTDGLLQGSCIDRVEEQGGGLLPIERTSWCSIPQPAALCYLEKSSF